jgi:hypothetical protein
VLGGQATLTNLPEFQFTFSGMATDVDGTIYIADGTSGGRIIRVDPTTGLTAAVAPPSATDYGGDEPLCLAVDTLRRVIISRGSSAVLLRQDPVSRLAPAASQSSGRTLFLATDTDNNIWYQPDITAGRPITKVDANTGQVVGQVGTLFTSGVFTQGDGGPASQANVGFVYGTVFDSEGSMYFVDNSGADPLPGSFDRSATIRKVTNPGTPSATITRYAGGGTSQADDIPALQRIIPFAAGLAIDSGDNLFIVETTANIAQQLPPSSRVLRVDRATNTITRIAGAAVLGGVPTTFLNTSPQPATNIGGTFSLPYINSIDTDSKGNVYIASGPVGTVWKLECSV